MSMGHSVVARSKKGVKDALSMTIPLGTGVHRRDVYVELEDGVDFKSVENAIKTDSYFCNDDTHVHQVSCVKDLRDMGHGVLLERKGVSGETQNQRFQFTMQINNPALTGQVLASCARAVVKQNPGCYTLPQIAPYDLINIDLDEFLLHTV
jgi:diaminopimelate dehydrogenase